MGSKDQTFIVFCGENSIKEKNRGILPRRAMLWTISCRTDMDKSILATVHDSRVKEALATAHIVLE